MQFLQAEVQVAYVCRRSALHSKLQACFSGVQRRYRPGSKSLACEDIILDHLMALSWCSQQRTAALAVVPETDYDVCCPQLASSQVSSCHL
jgi:hypothetical protein